YQELSPKYTVDLEKHLQVCDKCTQTLENWRAIHRGYQKTTDEAPAVPYLKQRILSAAKEELQRKPSFSERFFLVLKPALILPVILFGLIATLMLYQNKPKTMMTEAPVHAVPEQPSVSSSSLDLDKTKAPKREMYKAESKPDTYSNEREKPVDKETEEKLRSLGYISTGSQERDRLAAADEKAGAKDNRNKEYRQDAPASRTEGLEPQKESAPQEQDASKNETGQAAGGALAPSTTPPASAPAPVQQLEAKKMAKVAEPTFDTAQKQFQENNLNDGVNTSNVLIQQDKSQGRADYAVQFHQAGRRYQESKEPEQAIVNLNLVANNYPNYSGLPDVLLRLAESYEQIGDYNQALKTYQQLAQFPAMKTTADRRINNMQKKQKTRDQLKSLGYTDEKKN
ncbi:tetratricopeptide repeat protein, partial [bacterium]|nr:tetratricopeptide repeat protein [bacterium]